MVVKGYKVQAVQIHTATKSTAVNQRPDSVNVHTVYTIDIQHVIFGNLNDDSHNVKSLCGKRSEKKQNNRRTRGVLGPRRKKILSKNKIEALSDQGVNSQYTSAGR